MPGVLAGRSGMTAGFDVCVQLSSGSFDTIVGAPNVSTLAKEGGGAPLVRKLLAERLSLPAAWVTTLPDGIAAFADLDGQAGQHRPDPEAEDVFVDDRYDLGMALSPECVERLVRQWLVDAALPNPFQVRLKGSRGTGFVRWNVAVDLDSARAVLHAERAPAPLASDLPQAVIVVLQGRAKACGVGSLYADLDFTFELAVPLVPGLSDDQVKLSMGEAQFRLLRAPIAIEAFRSRIVASVEEHLGAVRETVGATSIGLGQVADTLLQLEPDAAVRLCAVDIRPDGLLVRGRLERVP